MDDMRRAFQLFDIHEMGKIDLPALRKVVKQLGLELSETELSDMIQEFDTDGDNMINESEFMAIMASTED
jgi:Ca2+-binding EF-hand superfamily protein